MLDAFNESYHVQGTHPQLLRWTDDTQIRYEQFGNHAHMGRAGSVKHEIHPSPRLGLQPGDWDERELLGFMMGEFRGLFLKEELDRWRRCGPSPCPGAGRSSTCTTSCASMLQRKGIDLSGLTEDQLLNADDCYFFPNVVGPIYPGSTTLFRVRPNGLDPGSTIKDLWTLEWPARGRAGRCASASSTRTGRRRTGGW